MKKTLNEDARTIRDLREQVQMLSDQVAKLVDRLPSTVQQGSPADMRDRAASAEFAKRMLAKHWDDMAAFAAAEHAAFAQRNNAYMDSPEAEMRRGKVVTPYASFGPGRSDPEFRTGR